jgi:putative transposase
VGKAGFPNGFSQNLHPIEHLCYSVCMLKAFKYRLYPSRAQDRLLAQTLETCRRWYNTCLAERKTAWEEHRESVSQYAQLRQVKDLKASNPYAATVHSHILQVVVQDLDKAFAAFFRRVRAGETPGYPRFRGRNRFDSFGLKEYGNGFKLDGRRLRLSGLGRVRVRWHRPVEGMIKTVRLRRSAGQWYACFACEVEPQPLEPTGKDVGLDVGVHHLLATSDGETVENPKWYRAEQARLRVLQRRVARRQWGGSNRHKAVLALQRQHERVAHRRKDFLNKLAHDLIARHDRIALEDLQIQNMARNRHLSTSSLDAGWGYLNGHLAYKAAEAGRVVSLVNPAHTSKTCSDCGARFENLALSDRWVSCACGLSLDRDVNAARNIPFGPGGPVRRDETVLKRAGHARWGATWPATASVPQEASRFYPLLGVSRWGVSPDGSTREGARPGEIDHGVTWHGRGRIEQARRENVVNCAESPKIHGIGR